jgi:hypothetical protein
MTKHLSLPALRQFTGSEHWYRHGLVRTVVFTDGAKYVAYQAGAYWLLDTIALSQRFEKRVAAAAFQVWTLTVRPDHTATLTCDAATARRCIGKSLNSRTSRPRESSSTSPTTPSCCRASISPPLAPAGSRRRGLFLRFG